jgi:hypothetical protein
MRSYRSRRRCSRPEARARSLASGQSASTRNCSLGESASPETLRAAQLWLRDLIDYEQQRFLDRHPLLAARGGVCAASRGGSLGAAAGSAPARVPWQTDRTRPEFWVRVIAVGVWVSARSRRRGHSMDQRAAAGAGSGDSWGIGAAKTPVKTKMSATLNLSPRCWTPTGRTGRNKRGTKPWRRALRCRSDG